MRPNVVAAAIFAGVFVAGCSGLAPKAVDRPENLTQVQAAKGFTESFVKGDFTALVPQMDDAMKGALKPDEVGKLKEGLNLKYGNLKSVGEARCKTLVGFDVVYLTCSFDKGSIGSKVVFDKEGKVGGFWIVRPGQD